MGSIEIFDKSSDDSIQDIVAVKTPSPLTSSHSSDSNSSFLLGINELTSEEFTNLFRNRKEISSGDLDGNEEYSTEIGSTRQRLIKKSFERELDEDFLSNSESVSLVSSVSSLKQRLRDLPSPDENAKLSDRIAELDRRIRREKNVYQQLQGLAERIEEKDEAEASSVADSASIPILQLDKDPSCPTVKDTRALQRSKMCSSAPETMRIKEESFEKPLLDTITKYKKPVGKNFDDRRPPKCLQPLEIPIKEIVRCNAPPLCLSDKKIVELLRRGSVSAREEFLRKSSKAPPAKLAVHQKLTGVIIKNLSSGSEEDCTNPWLIQGRSSVIKFEPEGDCTFPKNRLEINQEIINEEALPGVETKNNQQIEKRDESKFCNRPRSPQTVKTAQKSSHNYDEQSNKDTEISNDFSSSRSSKLMSSLQNSIDQLNSVLKSQESHSPDSRPLSVPKLEIQSQDYSQSPSLASREDSTKKSLDMNALICALSDVSIKQQKTVNCSSRCADSIRDVSKSTEPNSSTYSSVANESRQSMVSVGNDELRKTKNNYSKTLSRRSRGATSCDKKMTCSDNESKEFSKLPIAVGKSNEETSSASGKEESRFLSIKKSPKCRSTNSFDVQSNSVKLPKINTPGRKQTRNPKSPTIPRTAASLMEEKSSGLVKNDFLSFDSLQQDREKQKINQNGINSPVGVSSEPGTSRNGRVILDDHLSSRVTSGARDIFPRVSKDDEGRSLNDRFKYLQRGSKIPYVRSSESSSSEREENEFKMKFIKPSAIGFKSADSLKNKTNNCKFKIYEDTDETSPRPELTFPIEEQNPIPVALADSSRSAANSSPSTSCRKFHKMESGSTYKNGSSGSKDSNLNVSSPDILNNCEFHQRENQENPKNMQKSAESGNIFWADSSGELNRAMGSSCESRTETANYAIVSGTRSCLISPKDCPKKKKSSSSSPGRSSKIFSNRSSSIGSASSGSPRCRYDDNARHVFKNLAARPFENFVGDTKRKFSPENVFSSSVIPKRLSYSELQAPHTNEDASEEEFSPGQKSSIQEQRETSSPKELIQNADLLNSSQTNVAISGRSDNTVNHFRRAFDRATTRAKISSSLSKLTRSPEESTNFASRRKSQDRFPFTISESASAKSSSKVKAENAIKATSSYVVIEPSEMAYKLRVHPSLLRLASSGFEATAEEIIESASRDSDIQLQRAGFVKTFVKRFSSGWRRSKKLSSKPCSRSTKILYENKKCRVGSAEESSGNVSAEEPKRRFDRDGLWVEGLRDETNPNSEEETNQSPDTKAQEIIERYSNFLAKREQDKRQFRRYSFIPKTPMNSLMIDEDSDIDPSCFCIRMWQFLIGRNVTSRHRSSLFIRTRRSNLRRRV